MIGRGEVKLPFVGFPQMFCLECGKGIEIVRQLDTRGNGRRWLVEHPAVHPGLLNQDQPAEFCIHNAKQWVIEPRLPMVWDVEPGTMWYDGMNGRLI